LPSISGGQVQPFGVRKTIIGQAGRFDFPVAAGVGPDLLDLGHHRVEHAGQLLVDASGSCPSTKYGL
jgi:hypothetical protein